MNSSTHSQCPDGEQLRALLDGSLPTQTQEMVQAHVDECSTCQRSLESLTAGGESWLGVVDELKQPTAGIDSEVKLAETMARIKANDPDVGRIREDEQLGRSPLEAAREFLTPTDQPGLIGKLGAYEISEVVGQGGMGVVLKAFDPSLHRVVAVKVLASHLAHHSVARKRFVREAQAAAAVCHENVVTIHAIDESGAQPKIVMQFVSGGSLQERIDQEGPLDLKEILRIGMQTAAGLAAAHAQGLVHRDVKPANILLENGVQRVKLTDFGLARVVDDASLTLSGVIAGTPQYMAPEQAWGKVVDHRADLFGLGAVMYAMCVGHSPFRARSTMAVLKRVCEEEPRPISAINPDIPDWFCRIILKLLAKQPDARFQSAYEVSELLAQCLAHVQQPHVVALPKECSRLAVATSGASLNARSQVVATSSMPDATASSSGVVSPVVSEQLAPAYRIPFRMGAVPLLMMVLVLMGCSALFEWPHGPPASYFGFSVTMIAMTALCWISFYFGWSTKNERLRIASIVVLLLAGIWMIGVSLESDSRAVGLHVTGLVLFVFTALSLAGLVLVRPWLTGTWQRWLGLPFVPPKERVETAPQAVSPWYRLAKLAFAILIAIPLVFVVLLTTAWLAYETKQLPTVVIVDPMLQENRVAATVSDVVAKPTPFPATEKLRGRWVVLTVQGPEPPREAAELYGNSPDMMGSSPGAFPGAVPGSSMMGSSGGPAGFAQPAAPGSDPPQWIEITDQQLKLVGSREFVFDLDVKDGRELNLREFRSGIHSNVRTGIYLQDADRLVVCWTRGDLRAPDAFKASQIHQLVVCRREWTGDVTGSLPDDPFAESSRKQPPRADIPFTSNEAAAYQKAWAENLKINVQTTNSIGMQLRLIPPGKSPASVVAPMAGMPGGDSSTGDSGVASTSANATSQASVTGPILVGVHEVTRGQFRQFIEDSKYVTQQEKANSSVKVRTWREPLIDQDSDKHPVVGVNMLDAIAFTQWLSRKEEKPYRVLATEEWQFATRAGSLAALSIGTDKLKYRSQFFTTTAPVGSYSSNPFGLYDLIGNAAEWTWDTRSLTTLYLDYDNPLLPVDRATAMQRAFDVMLCGGDFATTMDASQPGRQVSFLYQRPEVDRLACGFRVAVDLTPASLLHAGDEARNISDSTTCSIDTIWCDLILHELDATGAVVQKDGQPVTTTERRAVVAIRSTVPQDEWLYARDWQDFEIQRAEIERQDRIEDDQELMNMANPHALNSKGRQWKALALGTIRKVLERSPVVTDTVPAHLTDPVLTSPIPASKDDLLSKFSSAKFVIDEHSDSSLYGHARLFRVFDVTAEPTKRYVYRYRLKYSIKGFATEVQQTMPWRLIPQLIEVPFDPTAKRDA